MKTCTQCQATKDLSEFSLSAKEYYRNHCKRCVQAARTRRHRETGYKRSDEYLARKRERAKNNHPMKKYGLTVDEVSEMKAAQDYLCAACHEEKPLVVDHNHATGKLREMLCVLCNIQLGVLEHPTRYTLLQVYLARHEETSERP